MKHSLRETSARSCVRWVAWLLVAVALTIAWACAGRVSRRVAAPPAREVAGRAIDWASVQPRPPRSFRAAKTEAWALYADQRVSFYCGCAFTEAAAYEASSCGFLAPPDSKRPARIEWEHLVPAHAFGAHRPCWSQKLCQRTDGKKYEGRRCCGKIDRQFRAMESDLHNLVPAVGELNAARANYAFGEIEGEARVYGACDFEVERRLRIVEPAPALRGDIARTYLYMHFVYGPDALPLSDEELGRFERWHLGDPPSEWERTRSRRIAELQGAGNPLLEP